MRSVAAIAVLLFLSPALSVARQGQRPLPPVSYVCPMPQDAEVIEDTPGNCPKCGMRLKPVRLTSVWTCPTHAAVTKDAPGACPIDGRRLIQVTMTETWTCAGTPQASLEPGSCPDGSPRKRTFSARPHGNHNPQHGGQFFMAADNWHHLEGTYPKAGVFRIYLYDDYTKPLPSAKVRAIAGHVTTADGRDIRLQPTDGRLEASLGTATFPVVLHARLRFDPGGAENLFDFMFPALTTDPPAAIRTADASGPLGATPTPTGMTPALAPGAIPAELPALLKGLQERSNQIQSLIQQGRYATVYVSAFEAKDLALALDERTKGATDQQREIVDIAVSRLVRDAYLLDAYGDLGNEQKISSAYADFASALSVITRAYAQAPR